ncbi:MAG: sodium:calcium antiporter [Bacteroidales bacterium]
MNLAINIIWNIILIGFSSYVIWRATDGFELASDYLGRKFSKGIKGASLNAIASSMPEFLATLFFLFYIREADSYSGGIGITGGSAVFNILVIPICIYFVVMITQKVSRVPVNRKIIFRDGIVLLAMTALVALVVNRPTLDYRHGLLLTMPYFLYLGWLFLSAKDELKEEVPFAYIPREKNSGSKAYMRIDLEKILLGGKQIRNDNAWILLTGSVIVMVLGTWLLVYGTDQLGKTLHIPLIFVSVVLAAAASSIPDTMISMRDAKKGNYEDAFSNALGSNIFDISFALGFPLLLYTLVYEPVRMDPLIIEASSELWLFLLGITAVTFLLLVTGKYLTRSKVWVMVLLYIAFIIFIIIELILKVDTSDYLYEFLPGIC